MIEWTLVITFKSEKKIVTHSTNLINSKRFQLSKRRWLIVQKTVINILGALTLEIIERVMQHLCMIVKFKSIQVPIMAIFTLNSGDIKCLKYIVSCEEYNSSGKS